ncbi:MAG: A24 family peptidase [Oscillospiraceae bacterium]
MQANSLLQGLLFTTLLCMASLWDIKKLEIPNTICALLCLAGLLCFQPANLLGILIALPFLISALWVQGGMGGGDIKLIAAAGFVLGFSGGIVGIVIGLTAALLFYLIGKRICKVRGAVMTKALPLAPFLSLGFITAYLMKIGGYFL